VTPQYVRNRGADERSVSAAGARPGLQNRGQDAVTANSDNSLRNSPPSVSALCQRAESDCPDLAAVNAAWPTLPEGVRSSILMLVKAASGRGGG